MSATNDLDYYRQRERIARQYAAAARDPVIAAIHGEMADRYAALIAEAGGQQRHRPQLRMA